jgi:hypothetical protein
MHRVEESAYFADTLQAKTLIPSAECVSDAHIKSAAGIATSKLRHRHALMFFQNGNMASFAVPIFIPYGVNCTVVSVKAGSIAKATSSTTMAIDVLKNGTTILAAPISLSTSNTNRVSVAGTVSVPAGVAGDWYEITGTLTGANPGTGLGVQIIIDEDPV